MRNHLPISSLREGHLIDLGEIEDWLMLHPEGTCSECDGTRIHIEFEYSVVLGVEWETDDCIRLDTENGSYGLPPDLLVEVIEIPLDNDSGL